MAATLIAINRYPVKSCRGEALTTATVQPWGIAGDRRWMIVDDQGLAITAREYPRLVLTRPEILPDGLRITHPDLDPLHVRTPDGSVSVEVDIWGSRIQAEPADPAAHAWFSKIIGQSARLFHLSDPTQRRTNPRLTRPSDRVSLADGYPLLLATEDSLAALNELIADGQLAGEGPLPMTRFRPSVVVRGTPAWAEDGWRRVRIGDVVFRAVKGCDRCVLTTVDPDTAVRGKEPLATLARFRKWDGRVWFAMNLVPDTPPQPGGPEATISIGDEVEVLDAVSSDGPPR